MAIIYGEMLKCPDARERSGVVYSRWFWEPRTHPCPSRPYALFAAHLTLSSFILLVTHFLLSTFVTCLIIILQHQDTSIQSGHLPSQSIPVPSFGICMKTIIRTHITSSIENTLLEPAQNCLFSALPWFKVWLNFVSPKVCAQEHTVHTWPVSFNIHLDFFCKVNHS